MSECTTQMNQIQTHDVVITSSMFHPLSNLATWVDEFIYSSSSGIDHCNNNSIDQWLLTREAYWSA